MTTKNLRAWQPVSVFAVALGIYPNRVYQIQDAYDLFDVRDATDADRPSKNSTSLKRMWRLKDGATASDVNAAHVAMLEAGGARAAAGSKGGKRRGALALAPQPALPLHPPTPETVEAPKPVEPPLWKQLGTRPKLAAAAVKTRVTHTVEAVPFDVSSPEELAQALLALARAVYPDTQMLALQLNGVAYEVRKP
jgi:hypothetical protein